MDVATVIIDWRQQVSVVHHTSSLPGMCEDAYIYTEMSPTRSCCGPDSAFINNEVSLCLVCRSRDWLWMGVYSQEKSHFTRLGA